MITDVLLDHAALVPVALFLAVLGCGAVGYAALRRGAAGARVLRALTALSLLAVLALTLTPSGKGASGGGCTVQFALPALGRVELLANVALLLPAAVFAALATRRPWAVLAAGAGLSALVETAQSALPAIGRACDTNDWAMNTLGLSVGVLLARGVLALADRADRDAEPRVPTHPWG
ncbi:VanZ family protein [Blastococcus sp. TML/C7B]|uniref:VanZ family protein n=1 Tax=Blastococcus sp. TML/C7B TaxID=2798728 RepID=UPI001909A1F3|nr:VanZ family protein [Blastococcus sp. TML/C7B]MBN1097973.1 VanZ family protein [Blastococcus sp. TML/C7B]